MAKRETTTRAGKGAAAGADGGAGQNFEGQLASLERIVRELERGDLPLERSLELFEQGVRLSRECQERLNEAERRIEVLLRDDAGRPVIAGEFETGVGGGRIAEEEEEADDESVF